MGSSDGGPRRSLRSGFVLYALLGSLAAVATLAAALALAAVEGGARSAESSLLELRSSGERLLAQSAVFAAEPAASSLAALRDASDRFRAMAEIEGAGDPAKAARLGTAVLADRWRAVEQAATRAGLGGTREAGPLQPGERAAAEAASASLLSALASYVSAAGRALEEAARSEIESATEASRLRAILTVTAALCCAVGVAGSLSFLVRFARSTLGDVRSLAEYAAVVARGEDYEGEPIPPRRNELGDLREALLRLARLERALRDAEELDGGLRGRAALLLRQSSESAALLSTGTEQGESVVRMLDQVLDAVQEMQAISRRSLDAARDDGDAIGRSLETLAQGASEVERLESLTNRIGEIVSTISSIADQTEILSLNAGIEAARAGGAGRGFTVVAGEVRRLADKSSRSALEISELTESILSVVQKITARTEEGALAMAAIQKGLERITAASSEVAERAGLGRAVVDRLGRAVDELAAGVRRSRRDAVELVKTAQGIREAAERLHVIGAEARADVGGGALTAEGAEPVQGLPQPERALSIELEEPAAEDLGIEELEVATEPTAVELAPATEVPNASPSPNGSPPDGEAQGSAERAATTAPRPEPGIGYADDVEELESAD